MEKISLLLATYFLALTSGYLSGRLITHNASRISLTPDTRPLVSTIHIEGIRNGLLHGDIKGNARVIIGSELFVQSGAFALDASPLLVNEISIQVPEWARFVASTRGKKYYPVLSSVGSRITPKNRVYFASENDARNAGYQQ